jgi:hypothetical protein
VLTGRIRRGAASEAIASLAAGVEYPLYTPYGNEAAAQGLLDALHATPAAQTTDQEQ